MMDVSDDRMVSQTRTVALKRYGRKVIVGQRHRCGSVSAGYSSGNLRK